MEIFKNKFLVKLIASICLVLTLINFLGTNKVYAEDEKTLGGVLLTPIVDLLVGFGDIVMRILHTSVSEQADVTIPINGHEKWWEVVGKIIIGVAVAAVAIIVTAAIIAATGGVAAAVAALAGTAVKAAFVIGAVSAVGGALAAGAATAYCTGVALKRELFPENIYLPYFTISVEEIFMDQVYLFGVNFFKEYDASNPDYTINKGTEGKASTAQILRQTVSTWYFILRNLALIVLMLLLIYSGIRIVIGSTAGEKAKHKERLMDWLIAVCLIFVMHYIMVFAVEIVEKIVDLIGNTATEFSVYLELTDKQAEEAEKRFPADEYFQKSGLIAFTKDSEGNDNKAIIWMTNLMGGYRLQAQTTEQGTTEWMGYSLAYCLLVLFTLFFAFTYLRRVVYMAFLTIIAPLVAMTYPIDKITDGKAQAFDAWLKEYIFNLMIQPLHLLLYTILVVSAYNLVSESIIYALVAIGFMMPAEKLMRRFFGYEKAKTPGLLGGAAGAALAMTGMQKLLKPRSNGGKSNDYGSEKDKDKNDIKIANRNSVDVQGTVMDDDAPTVANNSNVKNEDINNEEESSSAILNDGQSQDERDESSEEMQNESQIDLKTAEEEQEKQKREIEQEQEEQEKQLEEIKQNEEKREEENEKERKRRIRRNVAKSIAKGVGKQLAIKALKGAHPIRTIGKLATGATAATAGMLLGVASGEPSKVFQYTTGGAVAGAALADSLSKRKKLLDVDQIYKDAEMAYYEDGYKRHKLEQQKEAFLKNKDNINYLRQTTGVSEQEARDILKSTGAQCFDNGITNIEDIATIHRLEENKGWTFEKSVAARDYAEKRLPSDPDKMTAKSIREHKAKWAEEFKEKMMKNNNINSFENLSKAEQEKLEAASVRFADRAFSIARDYSKEKAGLVKDP